MKILYLLAIAAVGAAIWLRFRRPPATPPAPKPRITSKADWDPEPGSYNKVSIKLGRDACAAAKAIAEEHFDPQRAPRLPLDDCDQKHCDCGYDRDTQRREAGRRRADDGLPDFELSRKEAERREQDRRDR